MPADFVPFLPAIRSRISGGSPGPSAPVAPAPANSTAPAPAGVSNGGEKATVELVRDGGRVTLIRVRCRCGETIELDCEY